MKFLIILATLLFTISMQTSYALSLQSRDIDGDGIINFYDRDIDGDSILNYRDKDIDEDGIPNLQDSIKN